MEMEAGSVPAETASPGVLDAESRKKCLQQKRQEAGGRVIQAEEAQQWRSTPDGLGSLRLEDKIEQGGSRGCR